MKTCPKCHKSVDGPVLTCDCGYEFIVYYGANSRGDMSSGERNLLFLILTLAGLLLSAFWCFLLIPDITNRYHYVEIATVVLCLLVFGVNLYTLKITSGWRRWGDLPKNKKAIAVISAFTGLAMIVCTGLAFCLIWLIVQGLRGMGG
jgi:ABC-type branched-subunit amino acid transport system permease subunit